MFLISILECILFLLWERQDNLSHLNFTKTNLLKPFHSAGRREAGTDEAGRGCLAGPVFAAAVILPEDFSHPYLRDSKQLSSLQKNELFELIKKEAIAHSIQKVSPLKIDRINILNASILAMHKAIKGLDPKPEFILVDGNKFTPYPQIPHATVIKGDDKFYSIAAASVLAKVSRDRYMSRMAKKHPHYAWETNYGYPTLAHREGIELHGPTPLHRKSFKLLAHMEKDNQMKLFEQQ